MAKIRTVNFLPDIFRTPTNTEFLAATLDQLVNPPSAMKIQGYVGSKIGYGVNANDHYVTEPTKTRADYQLDPSVVLTAPSDSVNPPAGSPVDFITYPGIIDALSLSGSITNSNSRLFNNQFYSWDSFTDLDKIINYTQYYWLPEGPPPVTVSSSTIYTAESYTVTNLPNGYEIAAGSSTVGSINPQINLIRGGTYTFNVNQESGFWIQTAPGTSGVSPTQPNLSTRNVYGVVGNGNNQGVVTFNVPFADAQDQYIFPDSINVDVVSTIPFAGVEGQLVNSLGGIDGITSLNGLTVLFYDGDVNEIGYTSAYYDETEYDDNGFPITSVNPPLVPPLTLNVTASSSSGNVFTLGTGNTSMFTVNNTVTFSASGNNPIFGGITAGQVYYVTPVNSTQFTISNTLNGTPVTLTTATGLMTLNVNQGLWEEGFYSNVYQNLYTIYYVGDPANPIIRLMPTVNIPTYTNIVPTSGTKYKNIPFYLDNTNSIKEVPPITAPLDTLYYQDSLNPENVGVIKLVNANASQIIDVDTDIIGHKTYTSPNGVVFTNGLLVTFNNVVPTTYLQDQYYVQGVGTAIELVPASTLVCPENFTQEEYIPYDSIGFDNLNFDGELNIPALPDYITIARGSISRNAWSRSNRWFHVDVINATAQYNNDSTIITTYATSKNRAVRPIIEFYPNLKLFNSGIQGKQPVDYIDTRATNALNQVAGSYNYYPDIETYTTYTASIAPVTNSTSTTVTIPANAVTGSFVQLMFVSDSAGVLPVNSQITNISGTTTLTLTVEWDVAQDIASTTGVSIVASKLDTSNYSLFPNARIIFAADNDPNVRNKIYVAEFSQISEMSTPIITLTVAEDGVCLPEQQTVISRGYYNHGLTFFYDGMNWNQAQQKIYVNQPPLFDIFDSNGISLGDNSVYVSTSFAGCKLFAYGIGTGASDSVLGFPIRYSNIDNVGDISFDVSLNLDTFSYVNGTVPVTENVNIGYVYNYTDINTEVRQLGWQTAIADSTQYQVFTYDYDPLVKNSNAFICDVEALSAPTATNPGWPTLKVYIDNVYQDPSTYTYTVGNNATIVALNTSPTKATVIQILVLSNQASKVAYYDIPINLNNNPLNDNLTTANIGDIREQYQDIYINAPGTSGPVFGPNNYRDLGNIVPYGTKIIQNSASLVLPGAFLRSTQYNLFNALLFNSREYINYKQLIVNTVQNYNYTQRFTPSQILDIALQQITSTKSQDQAFFWSDMLPSQTPYISNTYTFNNLSSSTYYPLSKVYNFASANYNGVLVYHITTEYGVVVEKQLLNGVEYVISPDSPTLEVLIDLNAGDQIVIKEYNQTYGSYAPNTPTKLGLYPAFQPQVVLDSNYSNPTWFIKGHDGSFTKLYGEYDQNLGVLIDFRDQALFEFEMRVYNNLKLSNTIPISESEVLPGFFRNSSYSWEEYVQMYSPAFLNWVGQNRLDYKTQYYNTNNTLTYNYTNSTSKLSSATIPQGYWRGVYSYFYDTSTPNTTPWEMLGLVNEPSWWTSRYGPAPYTSDNGILWGDIEAGYIWNDGNPYTDPNVARPGLSLVLPVDSNGNLLSPFTSIVSNYNPSTFQKDWVVGDDGPTEFSYRRSSTYPFDLMRLYALTQPAKFFNLGVDLDNYKYSSEFNQYLINNRSHLVIKNIQVYGNGTAKTSYINWMVDFAKQQGVEATSDITSLLNNLDVRLVYRLAGFSDQNQLQFYVEKGSPNSNNASLLIPNESYSILLYENQPFDQIVFSGVIIQQNDGYWTVFGNSQLFAYFRVSNPIYSSGYSNLTIENISVNVANKYSTTDTTLIPYGTKFYSAQEVSQFLMSYGAHLKQQGVILDQTQNGVPVTWTQMVYEFLYWTQTGWENGSIININPAATLLQIDPKNSIVQPLTIQNQNFILNQDLYPIDLKYLNVNRDNTLFTAQPLNKGDSLAYGQFNLSNFEHGIIFNNVTIFNDIIYNLVTGLRQNRIFVRGIKSADWNGTVNAGGFIISQDNIQEWSGNLKYTKGQIVTYKSKYWQALDIVQPTLSFDPTYWKQIRKSDIQFGILANPSTRAYESTLYYDVNQANLHEDADLLSFNLIGYRPRDYLALLDLTSPTQVQIYQNMIKNMGTLNAVSAFDGASLSTGGISYNTYENWAILTNNYGGVLNNNFVDFRVNADLMSGDPSIVSLTNGESISGVMQEVPLYGLYNYGTPVSNPNILSTTTAEATSYLYPPAGYVNFNDVAMASYFYSGLPRAVDGSGAIVPIGSFYVGQYAWLANFFNNWNVFAWKSVGQITQVQNNLNSTATVTFAAPHNLKKLDPLSIINFANNVNGYYIVTDVPSITQVTINLSIIGSNQTVVNGLGIGLTFESHRVTNPSDIQGLDLIQADFIDNLVWVDNNIDGNWAVLIKSNNYQMATPLVQPQSTVTYGSAVAYNPSVGYVIGDAGAGELYRYVYDSLSESFNLYQTITNGTSFGSQIVYSEANNIYVVSQPEGTPYVYIYGLNDSPLGNDLIPYQTAIAAPSGVTNWGSALSLSSDANWLYVSDTDNNNVYVYRRDYIPLNAGYFVTGQTYVITDLGTTDFTMIGASYNAVGIIFVATGPGTGTGTATQMTYQSAGMISGSSYGYVSGDNFSAALTTNTDGSVLAVGAPQKDYSGTIQNWGQVSVFSRVKQNFQAQFTTLPYQTVSFPLAWTPTATSAITASSTNSGTNLITCSTSMTSYAVNTPIVFTGSQLAGTNIRPNQVYYIASVSSNTISIKSNRNTTTPINLATASLTGVNVYVQINPLYVYVNGSMVDDSNYAIVGTNLVYCGGLTSGDIITVDDSKFYLAQTFNSSLHDRTGINFGYSLANANNGADILVGSPFEISDKNGQEGAVYKFSNGGAKYGVVIGTSGCNVVTPTTVLINGYAINLSAGWKAADVAHAINNSGLINIQASATGDNNIIIQCIDTTIAQSNQKLTITAFNNTAFSELGIQPYTQTQIIQCPYTTGPTQFGHTIKIDAFNNMVVSAPVGTRYEGTLFDFVNNLNLKNDTVFDNNATQFIDSYPNAGAAYVFQYLSDFNESLTTSGQYVYAQSVNDNSLSYGNSPLYGTALDINGNTVVVGTPNFLPGTNNGQVVVYNNTTGVPVWSVYRTSSPVVDINRIENSQLYSASTNQTLVNFDYIDPLQGKILGVARENLDYVSSSDPAQYNSNLASNNGNMWGADHVGQLWLDTTNVRWVNYHQNDTVYNSKYWGSVFPGSDVAVYSWVASFIPPNQYQGPGIPYNTNLYCINSVINASNVVVPVYYFWVRNTNIIFSEAGKTLADSSVAAYVANPKGSGISYMAPLLPNTFAMYNSLPFFNGTDTVFHVGYSNGITDDVAHQEFALIRQGFSEDFLPGLPPVTKHAKVVTTLQGNVVTSSTSEPSSLYAKLLDSLSGCDSFGAVIPDPFLPLAVQSGVQVRPRQSFFYDRFGALKNYLTYVNGILAQYPISEIRPDATFLFASGEFFNTSNFWSYTYWWATGYDNSTKSLYQVPYYTDLATLSVAVGTLVTVQQNGAGNQEIYRYDGDGVWTRIGLQNGTIQFNTSLWDYQSGQFGWDGNFFDTDNYDQYPSQETYYIVRALSEQIFIEDLLQYRNLSLILLFQYIQSETIESQNFLPWLNKTSLLDVQHKLRELLPYENYVTDNFDFLTGYINEVKPYHVLIKDFLYDYTGIEDYTGNITDFDLPAQFNDQYQTFISPQIVYSYLNDTVTYVNSSNNTLTISNTAQFNVGDAVKFIGNTKPTSSNIVPNKTYYIVAIVSGTEIQISTALNGTPLVISATTSVNFVITTTGIYPTDKYQYLSTDSIWQTAPYTEWYQNYGLSLSGYENYPITTLVSYVNNSSSYIIVDNVNGFPINGVMTIDNEQIEYTNIDPALNLIRGLSRGVNGTAVANHYPGAKISINLPPVVLLSGGAGYANPPAVTAFIDTTKYPEPRVPAVLTPIMAVDSVIGINVVNPGEGYAVLPEIIIDPSEVINFTDSSVNSVLNTVSIYAPNLKTGNMVRYSAGADNVGVALLQDGQWYYVNVLQSSPSSVIAFYNTYRDAVFDKNRIKIYSEGQTNTLSISLGARAFAVTNSYPVRENNITIKFDRTTYNSQVIDWEAGAYYGSFFAGNYLDSAQVSSSSITLENVNPDISTILASAQGAAFEIVDVNNNRVTEYSSTVRYIGATSNANNAITLIPQDNNNNPSNPYPNAAGTTLGFYVGMPIKFNGYMVGGIVANKEYYVANVISETQFSISESVNGPVFTLTSGNVGAQVMYCFTAQTTDTAVLTINYPGILTVTNTNGNNNYLTVPTSVIGTGGTSGFYQNLPVFFTDNVIGGLVANKIYYVVDIIDAQTFTISETENGDVLQLSTDSGSMTMNVSLPVSPGQVNGQEFTIYSTSGQYPNITSGVIGNLIQRPVDATVSGVNIIALSLSSFGTDNFYVNMPVQFANSIGGLAANTTYYVKTYSGLGSTTNIQTTVTNTSPDQSKLTCDSTSYLFVGMPIIFSGTSLGGIAIGTEYYVETIVDSTHFTLAYTPTPVSSYYSTTATATSSPSATIPNAVTVTSSAGFNVNDPVIFSGTSFGIITTGIPYYVNSIVDATHITLSIAPNGTILALTNATGTMTVTDHSNSVIVTEANGTMVGSGDPYITVSATPSGATVSLTSSTTGTTLNQYVTSTPTVDMSYILGGYRAIITSPGSGFAINNTFTIGGNLVGGINPINNSTLTVNGIDSSGGITSVICSGQVPYSSEKYYLKVISPNQLEVYSNSLLTESVSGIDFPFVGFTTSTVTQTVSFGNYIVVSDATGFSVYDQVVFTGNVTGGLSANSNYYVTSISGTHIVVSATPGGSPVSLSNTSGSFTIAKAGSYAFLPEPFYFNQSIVKFNGRVYECVVSNNDKEFVIGKWQQLDSADPRLNAMDRTIGYYAPTVNMPGLDLSQLFDGVTYPNSIYQGNAFQPSQQYPLDTVLQDQPFYPTNVNITSVIYNNGYYFATANLPEYSGILYSTDGLNWLITKLLNTNVNSNMISYYNNLYVIASSNSATPVARSSDGFTWSANSIFQDQFGNTLVSPALQSIVFNGGIWVSVGDYISISVDTINWTQVHTYTNNFVDVELYGITYANIPGIFTGFVAVGSGMRTITTNGYAQLIPTSVVSYSADAVTWVDVDSITTNGFNAVAINPANTQLIAVGQGGVIYTSYNAAQWIGINEVQCTSINGNTLNVTNTSGFVLNQPVKFNVSFSSIVAGTTYYIKSITSATSLTLSASSGGSTFVLTAGNPPAQTFMTAANITSTLNNVVYANGMWLAVGNGGTIVTSTNGLNWTTQSSGVTNDLYGITFSQNVWTVTGNNNVILTSSDSINWVLTSVFVPVPPVYDVQGNTFQSGYGPEELVPGVITDNMAMTVITRPGVNWPVEEYGHSGYSVASVLITPTSGVQTVYSFAKLQHFPAQVFVQSVNVATGLGTTLYNGIDYTVNWLNQTITLANPLPYPSITKELRIDVYEVGNGDQLVKSNSISNPIRIDPVTGFNEIFVNCNYSAPIYQGSGVIQTGSYLIDVVAVQTIGSTNSIVCDSVSQLTVNSPISFEGVTFGNIVEGTTYYVKSVSTATSSIIVSATFDPSIGQAGPEFDLVDATGSMYVVLQSGSGITWTTPIIYHNGTKLLVGGTDLVTNTTSGTNIITTNSTNGMVTGTPITFSENMFGPDIAPLQTYYVAQVLSPTSFTISATYGGPVLPLTTQQGGAYYVTYDYAFGIQPNGKSAKIIFATNAYNNQTDYLVYSLFGETQPEQYGYTIPETQLFTGTGAQTTFSLSNYVGSANPNNAIVEVNGLRQALSTYTINPGNNTIVFNSTPASGATISVTTFNDTSRQYLNTQSITATNSNAVISIANINNTISPPLAVTAATATQSGTNYITVTSTSGFVLGQTVIFQGTGFGGIDTTGGTVYFVNSIVNPTTFTIANQSGTIISLTTATGEMLVTVGGQPSVRVTTAVNNNFTENQLVRIDGTLGSVQLNGNVYYARVINSTTFDLYNQPYSTSVGATNSPVTQIASYTGGGYTWASGSYYLVDTTASATATSAVIGGATYYNVITVASTVGLVYGTPVSFTSPGSPDGTNILGGLIQGTVYYVNEISSPTTFSVSAERYGTNVTLSNASGTINVTQWEQTNVDRLWVTVNGYRVAASNLKLYGSNEIGILSNISSGDKIIITNMIPTATPNQEIYMNFVNEINQASVYRANTNTRTWLTKPLNLLDNVMYINDYTSVTNNVIATSTAPAASNGVYNIGLANVDKNIITGITVFNNTTGNYISNQYYNIVIIDQSPVLQITAGNYINVGDSITTNTLIGNTVYVNGEQIRFSQVNTSNNTLTGLQRGANGTGVQPYIPEYTSVYSILSANKLPNAYYNQTWNSYVYDQIAGDPLQISQTVPALFLEVDVT